MEVIDYIRGEWAVISQSPLTFVIALVLLGGVIWAAIEKLYRQELSTKSATIEHLRERLEYKAAIASESAVPPPAPPTPPGGDRTLHQAPAPAPRPAPAQQPAIDPDAIYQRGRVVGKVIAPRVYRSESRVTFEAVTDTADLDRSAPFQYRDMTLVLKSFEATIGTKAVAGPHGTRTLMDVIEGVTCQIS